MLALCSSLARTSRLKPLSPSVRCDRSRMSAIFGRRGRWRCDEADASLTGEMCFSSVQVGDPLAFEEVRPQRLSVLYGLNPDDELRRLDGVQQCGERGVSASAIIALPRVIHSDSDDHQTRVGGSDCLGRKRSDIADRSASHTAIGGRPPANGDDTIQFGDAVSENKNSASWRLAGLIENRSLALCNVGRVEIWRGGYPLRQRKADRAADDKHRDAGAKDKPMGFARVCGHRLPIQRGRAGAKHLVDMTRASPTRVAL